MNQWFA